MNPANKKDNANIKDINAKLICFIAFFYFMSIFHFFALSEVHGILLALFKEIEREVKYKIKEKYDFKNNIIKDFYYFLTESNYHDSSQINFNYISSLFSIALIKLIKKKYKIEIVYVISIISITFISIILAFTDYLDKIDLEMIVLGQKKIIMDGLK